jgi:hypothetical protein
MNLEDSFLRTPTNRASPDIISNVLSPQQCVLVLRCAAGNY